MRVFLLLLLLTMPALAQDMKPEQIAATFGQQMGLLLLENMRLKAELDTTKTELDTIKAKLKTSEQPK